MSLDQIGVKPNPHYTEKSLHRKIFSQISFDIMGFGKMGFDVMWAIMIKIFSVSEDSWPVKITNKDVIKHWMWRETLRNKMKTGSHSSFASRTWNRILRCRLYPMLIDFRVLRSRWNIGAASSTLTKGFVDNPQSIQMYHNPDVDSLPSSIIKWFKV